jgi:nucleoid-associated protein YgaU
MKCRFPAILALGCLLAACSPTPKDVRTEDDSNPFFRQASKFTAEQNFHGALREYEKALRANPMAARPYYEMGVIYGDKLGDSIGAIYNFQRYLEARPDAADKEQVQTMIEKAKIDFLLTIPNSPMQNAEEMARLSKENLDLRQALAQIQQGTAPARVNPTPATTTPSPTPATAPTAATPPSQPSPAVAAPVAPSVPTTPASAPRTHTIVKGDNLWKIASQYYPGDVPHGIERIKQANPETAANERNLKLGQTLIIP